jgi:hypothetical protein
MCVSGWMGYNVCGGQFTIQLFNSSAAAAGVCLSLTVNIYARAASVALRMKSNAFEKISWS